VTTIGDTKVAGVGVGVFNGEVTPVAVPNGAENPVIGAAGGLIGASSGLTAADGLSGKTGGLIGANRFGDVTIPVLFVGSGGTIVNGATTDCCPNKTIGVLVDVVATICGETGVGTVTEFTDPAMIVPVVTGGGPVVTRFGANQLRRNRQRGKGRPGEREPNDPNGNI
jgi:hypothetical protein